MKGQTIAQISDTQAQLTLKRAEVELENARTQAASRISVRYADKSREVADAELQRATDSLERYPRSISATEIDRLRLSAEKAALAVRAGDFEFDLAQFAAAARSRSATGCRTVKRRQITSPLDGVVAEATLEGEWIEASKTVFRIVCMDRLRAEGFLHADQVAEDLVGRYIAPKTGCPAASQWVHWKTRVCQSRNQPGQRPTAHLGRDRESGSEAAPRFAWLDADCRRAESRQKKRRTEKWGNRNRGDRKMKERSTTPRSSLSFPAASFSVGS